MVRNASHPLKGKWIAHYHAFTTPWQTVSDLDERTALEILAKIRGRDYKICPETGKNLYLEDRLATEIWDRSQHLSRGGKIENSNPVYAMLWDSPAPKNPPWQGSPIVFPAELIPPELMSISIGDSIPNWQAAEQRKSVSPASGLLGKSYSPEEYMRIACLSELTTWPNEEHAPQHPQPDFYVEVRIYTRNNLPMQSILDVSADRPKPRFSSKPAANIPK